MAGTNPAGGWRGNDGSGGKRGPADARRPGWGDAPKAKTSGPRVSKNARRLLAVGALGVVLGLVVLLILLLRPPKSAALVLIGTKDDTNLTVPHNVYSWKALQDLLEVTGNAPNVSGAARWWSARLTLKKGPEVQDHGDKFDNSWAKFDEPTVVVFLALHGGADSQGAYFVTESGENLRLDTVIAALSSVDLAGKKKVLILDPTQVSADPAHGMLNNDFVRRLKEKEPEYTRNNIIVLCASDQDQRSWVSDEWGQSAFAHFVIEGLKGAAKKGQKGPVTVADLHAYVAEEVTRWAAGNRNALQTPIILPADNNGRSVDLVMIDQPYTGADAKSDPKVREEREARQKQWEADQPDLNNAWADCNRLREAVPSPAVYSPQLWREYRETLLRYEAILRAGDPTGAKGTLNKRLASLRGDVENARAANGNASLRDALPMPAVLGKASFLWEKNKDGKPRADEVRKLFEDFDTATKADRPKAWKALEDWASGQQPESEKNLHLHLVRLRVTDLLLRRVTEQSVTVPALEEWRDKLEIVWKPDPAAPVEAHTAIMLLRDLDKSLPPSAPEVIRQALRVRLLAEEAALGTAVFDDLDRPESYNPSAYRSFHPYGEQAYAWVRDRIEKADALRFDGENLMFTAQPGDWTEAGKNLTEAEKQYREAGRDAAIVRQALATRDRVLAELPYYSQWLARRRLPAGDAAQAKELADQVQKAEDCWKATHKLAAALEKPGALPIGNGTTPEGIAGLTRAAAQPFDELARDFRSHCQRLKDVRTQQSWQALEDALAVPVFPDADERLALLGTLRGIAGGLDEGTAGKATAADSARQARDAAQREGRLALAAIGSGVLQDEERKLRGLVENPEEGEKGTASLVKAGEGVRDAYATLAKSVASTLSEGARAEDVAKAAGILTHSAALARLLDPEIPVPATDPQPPWSPAEGERRCRLYGLLLWQGERTLRDRWASDNGPEPYFYTTGLHYVADARTEAVVDPADKTQTERRQSKAAELAKDLGAAKEMIVPSGPPKLAITDQPTVPVTWTFDKKKAPRGAITVWREATGSLLGRNDKESPRQALRVREDGDWPPRPVSYDLRSDPQPADASIADSKQGSVVLRGRYRGHRLESKVDIVVQQVPDVLVKHNPEEPKAGVYVFGDQKAYDGSLVIVLDASGSMGVTLKAGETWKRDTPCKFHQATRALQEVLRDMPPGTKASIWVFGHENSTKDNILERFPKEPNETFDPSLQEELEPIMEHIELKRPAYDSPIIKSMLEAYRTDLKNAKGIKTLLALTDGDDTDYKIKDKPDKDKTAAARRDLRATLNDGDTFVGVVIFNPTAEEWENGTAQMDGVKSYDRPGLFEKAEDVAALKVKLKQAMVPRLKLFRGARPVGPDEGLPISFPRASQRGFQSYAKSPALPAGEYTAEVYGRFRTKLDLHDGDRMFLRMKQTGNKITLERALMAQSPPYRFGETLSVQAGGDWLAALHTNRLRREVDRATGDELDLLVSVENTTDVSDRAGGRITQPRPGFVWFDVQGASRKAGALRWENEPGYPAPVWRVNRGHWDTVGSPAPVVEVWYRPEGENDSHATVKESDLATLPKNVRLDVKGSDADNSAIIEGVSIESLNVKRMPGKDAEPTDCLVVRLSYPEKRPVMVRLRGHTRGQQFRYYSEANKVTAIFYEVQSAEKYTLDLISVEGVKAQANEAKTHAAFNNLDRPNRAAEPFKPGIDK